VHTGIAVAIRHEHLAAGRKPDVGWEVERRAAMRHLFSCDRVEIVFRQAGIGAMAFDADGLQQPAIGGELHELLTNTRRWGQTRRNRRKAALPGSPFKDYRQLAPQKRRGAGRREPPRLGAPCKNFRQVAQGALRPTAARHPDRREAFSGQSERRAHPKEIS
jgi:hypothetical protein